MRFDLSTAVPPIFVFQLPLLLILFLIWRVLRRLDFLADGLGYNWSRIQRIRKLSPKLLHSTSITDVELAELNLLTDALSQDSPARSAQVEKILYRLDALAQSLERNAPEQAKAAKASATP